MLNSEIKKMQDVALHWTKNVTPYDKKLFVPIKEKFDAIAENDIHELDGLIVEKKAKLNCINIDPNAPEVNCIQILNFYWNKVIYIYIYLLFLQ